MLLQRRKRDGGGSDNGDYVERLTMYSVHDDDNNWRRLRSDCDAAKHEARKKGMTRRKPSLFLHDPRERQGEEDAVTISMGTNFPLSCADEEVSRGDRDVVISLQILGSVG
jgi:hypothetical protein